MKFLQSVISDARPSNTRVESVYDRLVMSGTGISALEGEVSGAKEGPQHTLNQENQIPTPPSSSKGPSDLMTSSLETFASSNKPRETEIVNPVNVDLKSDLVEVESTKLAVDEGVENQISDDADTELEDPSVNARSISEIQSEGMGPVSESYIKGRTERFDGHQTEYRTIEESNISEIDEHNGTSQPTQEEQNVDNDNIVSESPYSKKVFKDIETKDNLLDLAKEPSGGQHSTELKEKNVPSKTEESSFDAPEKIKFSPSQNTEEQYSSENDTSLTPEKYGSGEKLGEESGQLSVLRNFVVQKNDSNAEKEISQLVDIAEQYGNESDGSNHPNKCSSEKKLLWESEQTTILHNFIERNNDTGPVEELSQPHRTDSNESFNTQTSEDLPIEAQKIFSSSIVTSKEQRGQDSDRTFPPNKHLHDQSSGRFTKPSNTLRTSVKKDLVEKSQIIDKKKAQVSSDARQPIERSDLLIQRDIPVSKAIKSETATTIQPDMQAAKHPTLSSFLSTQRLSEGRRSTSPSIIQNKAFTQAEPIIASDKASINKSSETKLEVFPLAKPKAYSPDFSASRQKAYSVSAMGRTKPSTRSPDQLYQAPKVQIGQIDVVIEAPKKMEVKRNSEQPLNDLASRYYLRGL